MGIQKRAASGESSEPGSDASSPRMEQRTHSLSRAVPAHASAYPSEVQLQQVQASFSALNYVKDYLRFLA